MHHRHWYEEATAKGQNVNIVPQVPRLTGKQTQRNNVPATSPEEYYKDQ